LLALLAALAALGIRYQRGAEGERRQLSWLLLAGSTMLLLIVPWSLVAGTPVVVLFSIPLVPVAITVAIVRHQLLDIRVIVPRVLSWLLLSALVLACYSAAIAGLDLAVSARARRSTLITVTLVLLGAWLLPRVQALVDRAMYGDRQHPDRIATTVGDRLAAGDAGGLESVADAVRRALKLPYVALETSTEVVATAGTSDHLTLHREDLRYRGELVGAIVVGLRAGERSLAAADEAVLRPLAAPVAAALRATELSHELQRSRAMIITAREEERRRLRHDLHDGLGPALTGIGLSADAAANFLRTDPSRVEAILGGLRRDADDTLAEVHRILENLAPSVVDELGLVGALKLRARQLSLPAQGRPLKVHVLAPPVLPPMPAAVEIAAFRCAVEALTNIARHADARQADVGLQVDDSFLTICIRDDGPHREPWHDGIGLESMRDRALELGGTCQAGPGADGGRVVLHLPLRGS
ncbi:MAG: histidine kinase, partial [Nocardioidaceae bacterium]